MKDYQLTKHNLEKFFKDMQDELEETSVLVVTTQNPSTGKWSLARLWRSWMAPTAEWMHNRGAFMPRWFDAEGKPHGRRQFNANDAHELYTHLWLGSDENGNRLSWAKKDHDGMRAATKGERFGALRSHEEYAVDRGILLFKPRDSDYLKLLNEQNGRE